MCLFSVLTVLAVLVVGIEARSEEPRAEAPAASRTDSLRRSIETRLQRIDALRDSLSGVRDADFDAAIEDLGSVFEEIESELRDIDVTVNDEILKFSSQGGELSINIPENWEEKVSQGLSAITATILSELPDSLEIERGLDEFREQARSWQIDIFDDEPARAPEPRVVGDDVVSTGDDVVIGDLERVTGSVVVFGADATIMGTVDETVFVLGGTLNLGRDACVHGDAVTLFGSLRRHEDATVDGSVISMGGDGFDGDVFGLPDLSDGITGVLIKLAGLLVLGLLILLIFALLPGERLRRVEFHLISHPGQSFAAGLLWTTVGHLLLLLVLALLIVTVIGIPVAALLGLSYLLLGVIAMGVVARVLGDRFCRCARADCESRAAWWALLAGLFLILLPGLIGTMLGGFHALRPLSNFFDVIHVTVLFAVYCFGTGAVLSSRLGGGRGRRVEQAGDNPPA